MDLSELEVGNTAVVKEVKGRDILSREIEEMGFTPGSRVQLLSRGPFRSPLIVSVRGATIAIRSTDAKRVIL